MATPLNGSALAIADAKARLNRTPLGAYDLYVSRFQELRNLMGVR